MSISWSSMPLVLLIAKSAQHSSLSECQRIFLSATRDSMYACACVCECRCRLMVRRVCVCAPVLDSSTKCKALHNFNKLKIFLLWRTFLFLFFCGWCCATSSRCCCVFLFVFIKSLALRIFVFYFVFRKKKNIRSYFNLTSIYFAHNICSRLCASLCFISNCSLI